jgi:integrase
MSKANSTAPSRPSKPYEGFPLFPHASHQWAKKIRGRMVYFGCWDDPDAALRRYEEQKDDLHAGRTRRPDKSASTVKDLCNAFLAVKEDRVASGELAPVTWTKYKKTCGLVLGAFGKRRLVADIGRDDFEKLRKSMAGRWSAVRLRDVVQQVRSIWKFAYDSEILATPFRFGNSFDLPSKKTIKLERNRATPKWFEREEILAMLAAAKQPLKAMLLLGINLGLGNSDVAQMTFDAIDLETGWMSYPRPKTGNQRRGLAWPETLAALREWLTVRPAPKEETDSRLIFLTKRRGRWFKEIEDNPLAKEMKKLLKRLGIEGRRGFYSLRHVYATIASETRDQVAVDFTMGHIATDDDVKAGYRGNRIGDDRLRDVSEYVREWLFGKAKVKAKKSK